ncbi:hypothetical protein [Burkholderia phage BCSR5]|nr:hypothetical protein [Burkholderia phage BCSR5]
MATDRKELSDRIKQKLKVYYGKKKRAVFTELGVCKKGRSRADVFVLGFSGYMVIVEVKSSRADFMSDIKTGKWENYLPYCNQLYFAVPKKVYAKVKDDLPAGCGLFVIDTDDLRNKPKVAKKAKVRGIDPEVQANLVMRCAFRAADHTKYSKKRKADK